MTIFCEYAKKSQTSPGCRPRLILDPNLKISNNKIRNEKTNKQTTTAAAPENKQKNNRKQNKTGGVGESLGGSEEEKLRSIILRHFRGTQRQFSEKYLFGRRFEI